VRVVAFTGMPASGKSAAVAVAREQGFPVFRMGDLVIDEVKRRGLPLEEEHVGPVATCMRT
jgi:dephospho-CoA kinase